MHRHSLILKTLVLLLITSLFLTAPSCAHPALSEALSPNADYLVVFDDDFEGGNSNNWFAWGGWTVAEEDAASPTGGNSYLHAADGRAELVNPIVYSTYRLRADVRLWDAEAGFASEVVLMYRESHERGYHLHVMPDVLSLMRFDGESEEHLAGGAGPISTGVWHTIEISGTLGHIQVFADDELLVDYHDPDPWYAGSISLNVFGGPADFDNVQVLAPVSDDGLASHAAPWVQTNGPMGGAINTIEIDPSNPDVLYAGGFGGGVYKSTDAGATWTMLPHIVPRWMPFGDLLVSPNDSQTVYALTLDGGLVGNLYKSTDGGESWRTVFPGEDFRYSCVAMSQTNSLLLAVGTDDGHVYGSSDGGENWMDITGNLPGDRISDVAISSDDELWAGTANGSNGRLYHTTNGGGTWDEVDFGKPLETDIKSIYIDPLDPSLVYVGLENVFGGEGPLEHSYLWRTQNGGATWTPLYLPSPPWNVSIMGREPHDDALYVGNLFFIHKSTDGGDTWTSVEAHPAPDGHPYDIAVDPRDSDVLYLPRIALGILKSTDGGEIWAFSDYGILSTGVQLVTVPTPPLSPPVGGDERGGSDTVYVNGNWGLFKTTDRGDSWMHIMEEGMHPISDELIVSPHDPDTVWYVSDVGQVYITQDGGATWDKLTDPFSMPDPAPDEFSNWTDADTNFRFGSVYAVATAPSDPNIIYALKNGFGLFKSTDAGANWQYLPESEVDYTYSLAIHPANPDIVYSGYLPKPFQDWAMVRKTTDGGFSWRTVLSVPQSSGITSVAIDPGDPDTLYAGSTGKEGGAVYKSTDGGASWARLNEQFIMATVWGQPQLIVDPTNPSIAYAASWLGGTWKTTDAGETWTLLEEAPISATALSLNAQDAEARVSSVVYLADRSTPTVWKSTDGGTTWEKVGDFSSDGALLVMRVVADGDTVYAATFHPNLTDGKLYKSTDAGSTWADITDALPKGILDVAVDPVHSEIVYVTTNINGAHKSTDGGVNWAQLLNFPDVGAYDIEVDPVDPTVLYASARGGSLPAWFTEIAGDRPDGITFTDEAGVYRSTDSGSTWTQILTTSASCRAIRQHPSNRNVLFAVDLVDGLLVSADGGNSWTSQNTGLGTAVPTSIAVDGDKIYIGTQGCGVYVGDLNLDDGTIVWQADRSNKPVPAVYSLQIQIDPTNSDRIFVASYPGGLYRSDDGGATFRDSNGITPSVVVDDPVRQGYYTYAMNPNDTNEMWLGTWGKGIFKSYNAMSLDIPANGADRKMYGKHIFQIVVDPDAPDTVYVATEQGVFKTSDGGATWSDFNTGLDTTQIRTLAIGADGRLYAGSLGYEMYAYDQVEATWEQLSVFTNFGQEWPIWDRAMYQLTTVAFHPTDPNVVYVGTFPAGMFKTTDGGQTARLSSPKPWREINVGWGNDGVFSLVFHPENPDIIYAGTYNGINRSTDAGARWEKWDQGWPNEQWVFSLDFDPRDPNVMYACSKNGEDKGNGREGFHGTVMKSTDGGNSWFPVTTGLNLNQEFYKILVDPHQPDTLYLATQFEGVFISRDGGAFWQPWNEGLTHVGIGGALIANPMTLSADGDYLYLGTNGSGVFRRKLGATDPCPDLNGDGTVDIVDIILVAVRWGMTSDDPDWDLRYDLDSDGDIDIADIMIVVTHWGETC